MATAATLGLGTLIKKGDGASPEVFTAIAEVGTITGPSQSSEFVDVTNQDSTAREFIAGLIDPGEISFSVNYIPDNTTHKAILTDFQDKSIDQYELLFPTGDATDKWSFAAAVTGAEVTAPIDGPIQLSVTLKVSGAVTYAS